MRDLLPHTAAGSARPGLVVASGSRGWSRPPPGQLPSHSTVHHSDALGSQPGQLLVRQVRHAASVSPQHPGPRQVLAVLGEQSADLTGRRHPGARGDLAVAEHGARRDRQDDLSHPIGQLRVHAYDDIGVAGLVSRPACSSDTRTLRRVVRGSVHRLPQKRGKGGVDLCGPANRLNDAVQKIERYPDT